MSSTTRVKTCGMFEKRSPPGDPRDELAPAAIAWSKTQRLGELGPQQLKKLKRDYPLIWKRLRGLAPNAALPTRERPVPTYLSAQALLGEVASAVPEALDLSYARSRGYGERIYMIAQLPALPRAYAHGFACRLAHVSLRYYGTGMPVEAVARKALATKRAWMRGRCSTAQLLTASGDCFREISSETVDSGAFDPLRSLPLLAAAAVAIPNGPRCAVLTAWAYGWQWQWMQAARFGNPIVSEPKYDHALGKFRDVLNSFKVTAENMRLEDSDAGLEVEQLALGWEQDFRAIATAQARQLANDSPKLLRQLDRRLRGKDDINVN
jgi:hypothetical protein